MLAQELWQVVLLVTYPQGARLQPQDFAKDVSKDRQSLELSSVNMMANRPEFASSSGAAKSGGSEERVHAKEAVAAGRAAVQGGQLRHEQVQPVHVVRLVKYAHVGQAAEQRGGECTLLDGLDASTVICSACVSPGCGQHWDELCIIQCQDTADALAKTRTRTRLPIEDEIVLITKPAHVPSARL